MRTRKILDLSDELSLTVKGEAATFTFVSVGEETDHHVFLNIEELRQLRDWLSVEVLQDQVVGTPTTNSDIVNAVKMMEGSTYRNAVIDKKSEILASSGAIATGPIVATKEVIEAQKSAKLEDRRAISLGPTELKNYPQLSSVITKVDQFQVHDMSSQVGAKSTEAFSKEGLKKGDA